MNEGNDSDVPHNKSTAYLLWFAGFLGLCGLHRFYLNRPGTGFLYLLLGPLLVGQVLNIIDLFRLPGMVAEENAKHAALRGAQGYPMLLPAAGGAIAVQQVRPIRFDSPDDIRMKLVNAAAQHGGRLSVTQGVMATGKTFEEIEGILDNMARSGYVEITNDDHTGIVLYNFGQLDADPVVPAEQRVLTQQTGQGIGQSIGQSIGQNGRLRIELNSPSRAAPNSATDNGGPTAPRTTTGLPGERQS